MTESALDRDLLEAFLEAQCDGEPSAEDAALLARVGTRLQRSIAAPTVRTIQATEGSWVNIFPGIERKVLHRSGAVVSLLLRMQRGAVLPAHAHHADEECVVMQGRIRVGDSLVVDTGGFHFVAKGTAHEAITCDEDVALVFIRGMVGAH